MRRRVASDDAALEAKGKAAGKRKLLEIRLKLFIILIIQMKEYKEVDNVLEKPKTYEEAKEIIRSSTTSEMAELNTKILKLRAGLITVIGLGAAIAAGIVVNDPIVSICFMPIFGLISLASILKYFRYLSNHKKINDGTFFDDLSEEEVMKMAEEYVEAYNKYILRKREKSSIKQY